MKVAERRIRHQLCLLMAISAGAVSGGCSGLDIYSQSDVPARTLLSEAEKGTVIGHIEMIPLTRNQFFRNDYASALEYHLRYDGIRVIDPNNLLSRLREKNLPDDRILSDAEVMILAGSIQGRILFQGTVEETVIRSIPADRTDLALTLLAYDIRTGRRIAEVRVFAKNAEGNTPAEAFRIMRAAVRELYQVRPK